MIAALEGICAVSYLLLAAVVLYRRTGSVLERALLALACLATAAWAVSAALRLPVAPATIALLDLGRFAAWYAVALHLYHRAVADRRRAAWFALLGATSFGAVLLGFLAAPAAAAIPGRMLIAVIQLMLVENLYRGTEPDRRWHVGLFCVGLAAICLYDLLVAADVILSHAASADEFAGRDVVAILAAPLLAVSLRRGRPWATGLQASRAVAFHSAVLVLSGIFLLSLAAVAELLRHARWAPASDWVGLAEISLMVSSGIGVAVVLVSASSRNWLSRLLVSHLFAERYDYRRAWLACIDTLSSPDPDRAGGLRVRAIRALADIVDSPAGLLLEGDPATAGLSWGGAWNLPATGPVPAGHALLAALAHAPVLELDAPMLSGEPFGSMRLWLAIALPGPETGSCGLGGCVLLAPPRGPFRIDHEVTMLLGVVAREIATRLEAERATRALVEARDLRAYGERFAFVAHDIKNVAGQLRLLTANARVHIDNPAFQADMLSTIDASVRKIGGLIRRLETVEAAGSEPDDVRLAERIALACSLPRAGARVAPPAPQAVHDLAERVSMPAAAFDAALAHLLDNAVAAAARTGAEGAVRLELSQGSGTVLLDIVDNGPGMTAEFIRDDLFTPFRSRTEGGSGIGAFQARQLLRRSGGDLLVVRSDRSGTRMRLVLPTVDATALARSA